MRFTLGLVLLMMGIVFCALACYFAAMGLFARSPDNALVNYVVLAVLPFLLGLAMASIGWRGVKDARRDSGNNEFLGRWLH